MNRSVTDTMARTRNEGNYKHIIKDDKLEIVGDKIQATTKTINSQRKAMANYEKKVEQLTVRLPQGSRGKLNDYIASSDKYSSVNNMIKSLLENEIGQSLD